MSNHVELYQHWIASLIEMVYNNDHEDSLQARRELALQIVWGDYAPKFGGAVTFEQVLKEVEGRFNG